MAQRLKLFYRWLQRNWNASAAFVSVLGFLVCSLVPHFQNFVPAFLFLTANAIIWTLIELKTTIQRDPARRQYANMRQARADIIKSIVASAGKQKSTSLDVTIVGGRIRTISDIFREIKNEVESGIINARNITFHVETLDPDFVESWQLGPSSDSVKISERNKGYALLVRQLGKELFSFNEDPAFKKNNITIEVGHYAYYPFVYAYLIGRSCLYFGYFTWHEDSGDFIGPNNPCYYRSESDADFDDIHHWLTNRCKLNTHIRPRESVVIAPQFRGVVK